jgi:hypothetical protein
MPNTRLSLDFGSKLHPAALMEAQQAKIPLPKFLKIFSANNVPMTLTKAIAVAGKMWNSRKYTSQGLNAYFSYKDYNTPAKLSELDEVVIYFHLDFISLYLVF